MAAEIANQPSKLRWGELDEDDGEDLDFLLPPKQITTTTRIRKLSDARLSKHAVDRLSWPKFGDTVHEDVGSLLTTASTEEIILERPRAPGNKQEEVKAAEDSLGQIAGAVLMVCRTCGKKGDHWTAKCPYKDLATPSEGFVDKPPLEATTLAANATKGVYVPPIMGAGAERTGTETRRRNDVRVTNLSEDTREPDLLELFSPFGPVSRVYVAVDQKIGISRGFGFGFGFVNFMNTEDAERAINKLNGYGYDNLILRVEWAAPRSN
ncbi:hypothetical protein ACH5RR_020729 [Cinchona calisaya]|uniref:Eukaryotic translation initiation factor 3 subunit G n=1 Tax=Cinchona calisaya TaxID=153742 RepID=A0ABD2ZIM3_9GENT